MEPTPQQPEPNRPSSVRRHDGAGSSPGSTVAPPPPSDPADETPTIISLNRPRSIATETFESLQGKQLGHFELIEPIGVGGMAAVIRARDLQLGRIVALKILPPEMAVDPENINRFKQEARAAAKLDHENIARVYFCGEDQGLHFIAFEYVEGTDLRTLLHQHGPLKPAQAIKYMLQVAAGLAHAASRGVVHRDIKPSNIIITPEGRAKIVDMGLARSSDGSITQSGVTLGTFDYISPEQAIEPRIADVRSDIYSLGCTFYHLLTGQPPVPEGTAAKKLHHHQHVPPVDPRELNPAIPDELVAVLSRMMAKDPRDRYQRPEELIQHLLAVAQKLHLPADGSNESVIFVDAPLPQSFRHSPWWTALAAIATVAIIAILLGSTGSDNPRPSATPFPRPEPITLQNSIPKPPTDAAPAKETAPPKRTAADLRELIRGLEDPTVETIELTGDEYDLSILARAGAERNARPLRITRSVRLIGKSSRLPVIRWDVEPGIPDDGGQGVALLQIAPANQGVRVELANLRFVALASRSDHPVYAVSASSIERLRITNCEFVHQGKKESPSVYGGSIRCVGSGAIPTALELERCWFAEGACAIDVSNRALVAARQCAFGPHAVVFLFSETAVPATWDAQRRLADLEHCTALLRDGGAVFHVERNVAGTIRAGHCVFARGGEFGESVLIREASNRDDQVPLSFTVPEGTRNVYHNLVLWTTNTGRQALTLADCRSLGRDFRDTQGVFLPSNQPPWHNPLPLLMLDRPDQALQLRVQLPELRALGRPDIIVGVHEATFGPLYERPLPPLPPTTVASPTRELIVDPNPPPGDRTKTYRSIRAAFEDAPRGGDVTVLIRHTGIVEVRPFVIDQENVRLTIRPEGNHRPILLLPPNADALNPALFTIHNAELVFQKLQFRLAPVAAPESRWVSVVNVTGGGQVQFDKCVATLGDESALNGPQPALVIVSTDPERAGERKPPRIGVSDTYVRGKGHLVAVRGSRGLEFEARNVLAVLRGSLYLALGQGKEPQLSPPAQLTIRQTTAVLTEPVLDLRAADGEKSLVVGLVPTIVRCEGSLLVAAADRPIVLAQGVDPDSLVKSAAAPLLIWSGERNLYSDYQKFLDAKAPAGSMSMMMSAEWSKREWLAFTREPEESTARVSFAKPPMSEAGFFRAQPTDFRYKLTDMLRQDMPMNYGAAVNDLPRADNNP